MEPLLDDLLTRWQEAPESPPEVLCQDHPELLQALLDRIAILKQIERLAAADVIVPFVPVVPAQGPRRAGDDN